MEKSTEMEIGRAVITYNEEGNATSGMFYPVKESKACDETVKSLLAVKVNNEKDIITNAETLLAEWVLKVDKLETTDRTEKEIKSEIIGISRHANGIPAKVIIKFVFATV